MVETFRADYEAMQLSMIYGESPTFEDILRKLKYFNGQVRLMGTGLSLETIIEMFMRDQYGATSINRGPMPDYLVVPTSEDLFR